ncbi:nucleotidyltransferase domain-containing protein [Algoriphagus jejuensis]|uniref:Nucleotidyltransferase domain-containing protein n=1 Tax=Algoriphagus jejuensis TaxID=419934 RepID=A0ABN1N425_9BACT
MNQDFGINQKGIDILSHIFKNYPMVKQVKVYGSRAKGTYGDRSDLDLVILDSIDRKTLGHILMDINSSDFPLLVDLQAWDDIKNENIKDHIRRVGKDFYMSTTESFSENSK